MDKKTLAEIIAKHHKWLKNEEGGNRADLSYADLRYADLRSANLRYADLSSADLRSADLSSANLSSANLSSANLSSANLRYANLSSADLRSANLSSANLPITSITPDTGSFTGWKKLNNGVIARLEIPEDAKRVSSLVGRKCRAEFVKVIELFGAEEATSKHDGKTIYRAGEIVQPDSFDGDIRIECTHGIHFFITRKEAEDY